MQIDLLFDPFGARWPDVRDGALAAEGEGFDGVWVYDHLAGSVHGQDRVLEAWTTLTAIAATVPRIAIGPMVLNVANRDAGTLGVMAATLQEISGGRLLLGLGAGGGDGTPYAAEQWAFGRTVSGDRLRREAVETTVSILRSVWTGTVGGVSGFLRPDAAAADHSRGFRAEDGCVGRSGGRRHQRAGWGARGRTARHRACGASGGRPGGLALRHYGVRGFGSPLAATPRRTRCRPRRGLPRGAFGRPSAGVGRQPALTDRRSRAGA